jgi:hypothetical protein
VSTAACSTRHWPRDLSSTTFTALRAQSGEPERAAEVLRGISDYNEYDCVSTHRLFQFPHQVREDAGIQPLPPEKSTVDALMDDTADSECSIRTSTWRARSTTKTDDEDYSSSGDGC